MNLFVTNVLCVIFIIIYNSNASTIKINDLIRQRESNDILTSRDMSCTEEGFNCICSDLMNVYYCMDTNEGLTNVVVRTCSKEQQCLVSSRGCASIANPFCEETTTIVQQAPEFHCMDEWTFPDPYDCTKYHICSRGLNNQFNKVTETCTNGLNYNAITTMCDLADCQNPPIAPCTQFSLPQQLPINPNMYYMCVSETNTVFNHRIYKCPDGEIFVDGGCTLMQTTAETESSSTETPVTNTPVTEIPVTETPVTETPVTETPVTETPVTETPVTETPVTEPEITEITPTESITDQSTEPSTEITDTTTQITTTPAPICQGVRFYPAESCLYYFDCFTGEPVLRKCPPGYSFSQKYKLCVKSFADCQTTTTSTTTTQPPAPSQCNGEIFIRDTENCINYFDCRTNPPTNRQCPIGQSFSSVAKQCVVGFYEC